MLEGYTPGKLKDAFDGPHSGEFAGSGGLMSDGPNLEALYHRAATSPIPMGSPTFTITMGIVVVACLAARIPAAAWVTITSTSAPRAKPKIDGSL
jgi:hypothetical protein